MFYSPLRYPGGKGKLSDWFLNLMRANKISGGTYIEAYAGGAGIALFLLLKENVRQIIINDYDPAVYKFWYQVLNNTDEFTSWISTVNVTMDEWYKQHEIITSNYKRENSFKVAKAFFFLNRTNRSGVVKGGVIGGKDQKGNYKIDARFNKEELIERIQRIAKFKNRIKLTNKDAKEFLGTYSNYDDPKSLIYLDPPYYKRGGELYMNAYTDDEHKDISREIIRLKTPWVLTYDNHPRIKELYKKIKKYYLPVRYSAQARRLENELLLCGNIDMNLVSDNYDLALAS
jgi:DNA adenine methylase